MYVTSWSLSFLLCEVWTVILIVKSVMKLRPCSARSIHVVDGMVCTGLLLSAQLPPLGLPDACLPDRSHWSIASAQCLPSASLFLLIFPSFTLNSTSATHWVYEGCQPSALSVSSFSLKFIHTYSPILSSVQFSSVAQLCPTLCDPMDCSTPGLPVHHQLPEFTQTHVHWVGDAIQPSHPLSSPSLPALNFSQHQGLSKWVSASHHVAKVLEFQLQHQFFQWIPRIDLL